MTEISAFSLSLDVRDKAFDRVFSEQVNSIFCVVAIARSKLIQKPDGVNDAEFVDQSIFSAVSYFGDG